MAVNSLSQLKLNLYWILAVCVKKTALYRQLEISVATFLNASKTFDLDFLFLSYSTDCGSKSNIWRLLLTADPK